VKNTFWVLFLLLFSRTVLADDTVILVVGDSISAAHGMEVRQGWVQLLQQRLDKASLPYRVINASISGDTSANAWRRLPILLEQYRPKVLLLEVGGNDGLRGLSPKQMAQNLSAMIETARERGIQVLLLGIQLPPNYGRRYTAVFEQVYRDQAARFDIPLVPSVVEGIGGNSELMQDDGIHPNAVAQPLILELVWNRLEPMLSAGSESAQRATE